MVHKPSSPTVKLTEKNANFRYVPYWHFHELSITFYKGFTHLLRYKFVP